ncbi:MAG: dTMP kinase [Paludisphaera borealis]|uniref:dTMP kinase n=1 Tax=Paludisphaera borealis TaxID=1387353 RepID=UPI00284F474E|nr:dTMP kinase [Paludisphaera borealis]MDR3621480.1 dTMP kinase [Paludisphaera borealis]
MTEYKLPSYLSWERPHPGFFLAFEGPDGGGKSTQAARLADWLREDDEFDVVTCRDPGSTPLGNRLRELLLERGELHPNLKAEMLLFMASRAQLVEDVIRPALAAGRVVICDRFLLSNIVYQGVAGGLPIDEIARVGQVATGGLLPDLTLVLNVSRDAAKSRIGASRDRLEDRPESYHAQVNKGFSDALVLMIAGPEGCPYYPSPMTTIDASKDADDVARQIRKAVANALRLGSRP